MTTDASVIVTHVYYLVHGTRPIGFFPRWMRPSIRWAGLFLQWIGVIGLLNKISSLFQTRDGAPISENWISCDHKFRHELNSIFSPSATKTYILRWTGGNTVSERYDATRNLLRCFERGRQLYPRARHIAIGHSHGGNIIVAAIARLRRRNALEGLVPIEVVAMSTPFLVAEGRRLSKDEKSFAPLIYPILFVGIFAFVRWLFVGNEDLIDASGTISENSLLNLICGLVFGILAAGLSIWYIRRQYRRVRYIRRQLAPRSARLRRHCPRMLTIRMTGDEASLVLGASGLATSCARFVWPILSLPFLVLRFIVGGLLLVGIWLQRIKYVGPLLTLMTCSSAWYWCWLFNTECRNEFSSFLGLIPNVLSSSPWSFIWLSTGLAFVLWMWATMAIVFICAGVFVIQLIAESLLMSFIAIDLVLLGPIIAVWAEASPPGVTVNQVLLRRPIDHRGMRHSIYNLRAARVHIWAWIRELE